ncbi:hypothetical protein QM012_001674 [Aureobasidium pullulans]|uniref:Uncharacterized protein n=1 Tax=Aureobasidium pullulans TaxID=5580 RepID=A0ABR0TES1_AURPU
MSARSNNPGGQVPSEHSSYGTFTRYPAGQARSSVAGRRRVAPRREMDLNIQATYSVRDQELQYTYIRDTMRNKPDINKPLPPLPDQQPSSRPASPIDRAADWVNKKVVTPVKEFFKTPEVDEMIEEKPQSPANESRASLADPDTKKHSRAKSNVDRLEVFSRRSGSISSRETFASSPSTPRSRLSESSIRSNVRHAFDSAQQLE